MKKILTFLFITTCISCNNQQQQQPTTTDIQVKDTPRNQDTSIVAKDATAANQQNSKDIFVPNFTCNDVDGKPINLKEFYTGKKLVLIDFWASWCGPCRMENPNVVEAYKKYHSKGFEIIGVSLDKNKNAWTQAIKEDNLIWTQVSDLKFWQSDVAVLYGVQSIPTNFLIDGNGKLLATELRGADLENKLAELLK